MSSGCGMQQTVYKRGSGDESHKGGIRENENGLVGNTKINEFQKGFWD